MLFNSIQFLVFLPLAFAVYWLFNRNLRLQNLFVVAASYVFYGWWDWRFLVLIAFTSAWSYLFGLLPRSKWNVAATLVINLGILGAFKYYNFFVDSWLSFMSSVGFRTFATAGFQSLNIILPVGISFYTFQALSYTLDVYRGTIRPTKDPVAFFAFISFFPQLVAGPIERAANLLPQFLVPRTFSYPLAVEGCRQMIWGFAKKVVIADSCAMAANQMLNFENPSSISLWIGVTLFAFQIYCDFSGYSDIAIGCSKLFGIRLMRNFAHPYFARDIAEFWRRWHISLTTWFRDYLYIPLGGSRCGTWGKVRNTFAIFLVSGFWHGANWTFIAWGAFHAFCFLPLLLLGKNRKYTEGVVAQGKAIPSFVELGLILRTFLVVVIGWALFRAPDISTCFVWFRKMFAFSDLRTTGVCLSWLKPNVVAAIVVFVLIEWFNRDVDIPRLPKCRALRWAVYYLMLFVIFYWDSAQQTFIYFQF